MRTAGFALLLLGASSFLFKIFGRHSLIMSQFGEHEQTASIVALAAGAVLFGLSFRKKKETK